MSDPEGEWDCEADDVLDRYPLILGADGEHVFCNGPRDGERVELSNVLPGPYVRAFDGSEELSLVVDYRQHHAVVQQSANRAA